MGNRVAHRLLRNPWLAPILLAAFFLRALVPIGYMPGPGGLMLCSGYAEIETNSANEPMALDGMSGMHMPESTMPLGHGGKAPLHDMTICPFAGAATAYAPLEPSLSAAFIPVIPLEFKSTPQPFIPRATLVPSRFPRGPPAIA